MQDNQNNIVSMGVRIQAIIYYCNIGCRDILSSQKSIVEPCICSVQFRIQSCSYTADSIEFL